MANPLKILISGGMGGIGRATAVRLAKDGHRVCVLYHHTPKDTADAFVASLGEGHTALPCDMSQTAQIGDMVQEAYERLGGLDVCVHAAVSPLVRQKMATITLQDFRAQFEVTTFGGLALFQAVLPYLQQQKRGVLIGITSATLEGRAPSGMAGYLAAKFALHGVLRDLAAEVGAAIAVHELAPGFVDTPLNADLPQPVREFITSRTPTQTPEDVAADIAKLCVLP
ncbi:MAG: SDR family oxidoreductase [Patescibacteria group bacterium]